MSGTPATRQRRVRDGCLPPFISSPATVVYVVLHSRKNLGETGRGLPVFLLCRPIVLGFVAGVLRDYAPCELYNLAIPGRTLISRIPPVPKAMLFVIPWEEWGKETRILDGWYMRLGLEHQPVFGSQLVYVEERTRRFRLTMIGLCSSAISTLPGLLARDTASKDAALRQSIVSGPSKPKKTVEVLQNPMLASAPY